jgi:CubicO group peptidase (beta-lactamase class C family)
VEQAVIFYNTGNESDIVIADARLYKGTVYLILARADSAAYQERSGQLGIIASGFTISTLEVADLSGADRLPLSPGLIAELEAYIREAMALLEVPGAAVAIVQEDEIVYAQGFGVRERGSDQPVTPETLMMIGSTNKTLTTMLMAQLVDEGLMAWDTPVVDILPTFEMADPDITQRITVRHLVCACTGVPRRDAEAIWNFDHLSAEDIVESLAGFELRTGLGEMFQYSNQMVATGGYVAALAAGAVYGELYDGYVALMERQILDPIGMASSTFLVEQVRASANYAVPHSLDLSGRYVPIPLKLEEHVIPSAPAGALWSNVLDMGRYLLTLLNQGIAPDGTRIVSAKNLAFTWTPQIAVSADTQYGLGWFVGEYKGLPVLYHGGNTFGFTSDLALLPQADLGIIVLANQFGSSLNQAIRTRLFELIYRQEPEQAERLRLSASQQERSLAALREQLAQEVSADRVAPYLGVFANEWLGEIVVELDDGTLVLDAGEFRMELLPRTDQDGQVASYWAITPPWLALNTGFRFSTDGAGNPTIVRGAAGNEYTFVKVR